MFQEPKIERNNYNSPNGNIELPHHSVIIFYELDLSRNTRPIPPIISDMETIISATDPDIIVPEYFPPAIAKNVGEIPIIGKQLFSQINELFPRIMQISKGIENIAAKKRKRVAVTDIANNAPAYMAWFLLQEVVSPIALNEGLTYLTQALIPRELQPPLLLSINGAVLSYLFFYLYQYIYHKGFFDKEKIHKIERFLIDLDDARRYLTAKALEAVDKQNEGSKILVILPRAHKIRIQRLLTDPKYPQEWKTFFYKHSLKPLHPGFKIWEVNNSNQWERTEVFSL